MDRHEAVTYLKDLLIICSDMSPDVVSVENIQTSDSLGYRVHIKGCMPESERRKVKEIAKKHSLLVKENHGEVIVYKPK